MSWLSPGRWLFIGGLLAALWLGYGAWAAHQQGIGEARATASYNTAIDKQKAKAGQLLATETQKAAAATKALHDSKAQREIDDAKNASTVAALAGRLRAASTAGRLRDPHAAGCGCGGGGAQGADPARAGGGAADAAEAGGLFSAGATELFQRLTRHAADIIAPGFGTPYQIAKKLAPLIDAMGVGQLIFEHVSGKQWVHVSTRMPEKISNRVITIGNAGARLGIQVAA